VYVGLVPTIAEVEEAAVLSLMEQLSMMTEDILCEASSVLVELRFRHSSQRVDFRSTFVPATYAIPQGDFGRLPPAARERLFQLALAHRPDPEELGLPVAVPAPPVPEYQAAPSAWDLMLEDDKDP
jgi:hypothetical protein